MTRGGRQQPDQTGSEGAAVNEPLTLTDPDGAVTRVAPWSTWTREQHRVPGGDPELITRLESGQLWFTAGPTPSPWRHQVLVGPATITSRDGRFQVVAEADGGATVNCLAGQTRVVTALQEPLVLGPSQTAAVSADGQTLVVMDRADPRDAPLFAGPVPDGADEVDDTVGATAAPEVTDTVPAPVPDPVPAAGRQSDVRARARRLRRASEIIAVLAVIAVVVAAAVVFGNQDSDGSSPARRGSTSTVTRSTTTRRPGTTTTRPPVSTTVPVTAPIQSAPGGVATGTLTSCRRSTGGVNAVVDVLHRTGRASAFVVEVALVDDGGRVYARGRSQTPVLAVGARQSVRVAVSASGALTGSCQLVGVDAA